MRFLGALALVLSLAGAQEETEAQRLWRLAREGRAVVRPQAAARFVGLGDAARTLALEATAKGELADLGPALVGALAELGDPVLRGRVTAALDDRDFPWRPAAAEALAAGALGTEHDDWTARCGDPIAPVRAAAVKALDVLDARDERERVQALLGDGDSRVRRRAALALDRWGEPGALFVLLEELRRDDLFFGAPVGMTARFEAAQDLAERLGRELSFRPERAPTDEGNRAALTALEATLVERGGKPPEELPPLARALDRDLGEVLGLEVRSCRRGEYDLRFTADDVLWIGRGGALRIPLPEGTVAALLATFEAGFADSEPRLYGEAGCDGETFHLRPSGSGRSTVRRLSKGPAAVDDLRPAALDRLARALVSALPDRGLAREVASALVAVGGALE